MDWDDVLKLAASFFLVVTGITLAYALIRAARTLDHVSDAIDTTVKEAVPLLGKAGEAIDAAERSARAVVAGVTRPVSAVAGAVTSVDRVLRRAARRPRD
jgi:hypothetical protein